MNYYKILPIAKRSIFWALLIVLLSACNEKQRYKDYPTYWCWQSVKEDTDLEGLFEEMKSVGFESALINAPEHLYPSIGQTAIKHGIELHAWQIIMMTDKATAEEHPEWLSVNRNGHSLADSMAYVPYYRFMCPILPDVKDHIFERISRIAQIEGVKGISLDYTRYVDVILPGNLWSKYGIIQDKEYPQWDYGYHPAMIDSFQNQFGYNPLELADPSQDELWKQFRYDLITDIANECSRITRQAGKLISASPFPTPTIARKLVRQDWDKWELDFVFPMVYNGMYLEEGKEWMQNCIEENISAMNDRSCEVYTGIYIPGHRNTNFDLNEAMATVFEAGSRGFSLFDFRSLSDEEKNLVKEFIAGRSRK